MYMDRRKLFTLLGLLGVTTILVGLIIWNARLSSNPPLPSPSSLSPSINSLTPSQPLLLENAFSSSSSSGTPSQPPTSLIPSSSPIRNSQNTPVVPILSVPKIESLIAEQLPLVQVAQPETLSLPAVTNTEMSVSADGSYTFKTYAEEFARRNSEHSINSDTLPSKAPLLGSDGLPLLLNQLVERGLASGFDTQIQEGLSYYQNLLTEKLSLEKTIPVAGEAINVNRTMIALDKLGLTLITKSGDFQAGSIDKKELSDYLQKYKNTDIFYQQKFRSLAGLPESKNNNLIADFLENAGLLKEAQAVGLGFGGMVLTPTYCVCNGGFWVIMGPPTPGSYFLPMPTYVSPLIYQYKSLRPGAYWLGNFIPAGLACQQPPFCEPTGFMNAIITMAGTSV